MNFPSKYHITTVELVDRYGNLNLQELIDIAVENNISPEDYDKIEICIGGSYDHEKILAVYTKRILNENYDAEMIAWNAEQEQMRVAEENLKQQRILDEKAIANKREAKRTSQIERLKARILDLQVFGNDPKLLEQLETQLVNLTK